MRTAVLCLVTLLPGVSLARDERPVFSLYDNRLLAHQLDDGALVVRAGSASFARYVRFGKPKGAWTLRAKVGGRRVAKLEKRGVIEVPLTQAQVEATRKIHLRVHSRDAGKLDVRVGGKKRHLTLDEGWQTLSLPAGTLVAGENAIELTLRRRAVLAIEWVKIGGEPSEPGAFWDGGEALTLPKGDGLAFYVHVPPAARLVGDVAGAACQVAVSAFAQEGRVSGRLSGRGAGVDLAPLAGRVARLELTGDGCPEARLERAALAVPGPAPRVARAGKPPRYVIFWIMDTLRADRVRPWQPDARAEVPNFEKLAKVSTVFRQAYVQGNASTTSHASIWTSLYPINHRVISAGEGWTWRIDPRFPTLGELVKAAGFYLSGVTANGFVTADAGYGEGFDKYLNLMHEVNPGRKNGAVPGETLVARALASVKKKVGEPFLLFIGTIDTHAPWIAREPWTSLYDPGPYKGKFKKMASGGGIGVKKGRMISTDPPAPRDLQRLFALYDTGVSYQDSLVGKLLETLDKWGIRDETMIVITADHGEELFEDGRGGHGGSLRETLVHVPLLIHYPPLFPAGVVEEGVDDLDLLPTVLDALDKPIPAELQGASLLPLAHGVGGGYPRPSFASQYEWYHCMRIAGWKMRVGRSGIPELYHVEKDPLERNVLTRERPLERRFLTDAFALFLMHQKTWKKSRWGVASNMSAAAARELDPP